MTASPLAAPTRELATLPLADQHTVFGPAPARAAEATAPAEVVRQAFKVALAFWLAGWVVKVHFFWPYFTWVCLDYPLVFDFFPAWAASPWVSLAAYLGPLVVGLAALGSDAPRLWRWACAALTAGSLLLCVHQNSYNDATFITSFWASLWMLWLVTRGTSYSEIAHHGPRLAQAVISLMFLGGAIGKLTPDYWNGTAFYHLYFQQKANFIYPWLRSHLSDETLLTLAAVFSRAVIVGEFAIAALVCFASRQTLLFSVAAMVTVVAISTNFLFSVMGCLIGIALAGARLPRLREAVQTSAATS